MPESLEPREVETRESFTKSFTGSGDTIRSFTGGPSEPQALPAEVPFSVPTPDAPAGSTSASDGGASLNSSEAPLQVPPNIE